MDFFFKMLNMQLTIFFLLAIGFVLRKTKIITPQIRTGLTDLLVSCIVPCNIISSFSGEINVSSDLIRNCVLVLVICTLTQLAAFVGGKLIFRKYPKEEGNVLRYGLICPSSNLVGMPIAESLYGSLGVMYCSIYQIPVRITIWTVGIALFTGVQGKNSLKKLMLHPCILSVFAGVALMLCPWKMPALVESTISMVGKCTLPMSMFIVGSILAEAHWKGMLEKPVLHYVFVRLIAFPVLVWLVLQPFHLDPLIVGLSMVMTSMPAGANTSVLAAKYGCNEKLAVRIAFMSTALSIITVPILCLVLL